MAKKTRRAPCWSPKCCSWPRPLKKTVEWVRYPGESHGFIRAGRRETRVDAHQRLLDWFNRHLAP